MDMSFEGMGIKKKEKATLLSLSTGKVAWRARRLSQVPSSIPTQSSWSRGPEGSWVPEAK